MNNLDPPQVLGDLGKHARVIGEAPTAVGPRDRLFANDGHWTIPRYDSRSGALVGLEGRKLIAPRNPIQGYVWAARQGSDGSIRLALDNKLVTLGNDGEILAEATYATDLRGRKHLTEDGGLLVSTSDENHGETIFERFDDKGRLLWDVRHEHSKLPQSNVIMDVYDVLAVKSRLLAICYGDFGQATLEKATPPKNQLPPGLYIGGHSKGWSWAIVEVSGRGCDIVSRVADIPMRLFGGPDVFGIVRDFRVPNFRQESVVDVHYAHRDGPVSRWPAPPEWSQHLRSGQGDSSGYTFIKDRTIYRLAASVLVDG